MITVQITRDSVCAGDDVDAPHEINLNIDEAIGKELLLQKIAKQTVDIQYPEQKWVCIWNGERIAEYSKSESRVNCEMMTVTRSNVVHFKYEWVKNELGKGKLG